ncbi:MAG: ABC transporter ATP-binding protein [Ktedonobacteraceae bacterium]
MKIEIGNLNKVYRGGIHALEGVNLSIASGMYGLLGPNGAGKTTLMRILAGILRPSAGKLSIGGYDYDTEKGRVEVKRLLGYLPQEMGVYPDLNAREFLDYVAILKGLDDRRARQRRVDELLEIVSLTTVARRKLKTFSGGMKRRVGIAQALLNDPKLLIVDEPTAGLDPEERIRFRNLLSDLGGERTVLLSTHIVEDIAQTCRNLAILKNGRVVFQGTTIDLIGQARGKVWVVTTNGARSARPTGNITVVSTMHMDTSVQYRVVGELAPSGESEATLTEPSLEDSYVWLMREQREHDMTIAN